MPGLYTLGQYTPQGPLRQPTVLIYFGSFKRAFPHMIYDDLRKEVAKTILHELLHHWEIKSGYDDLGAEDRVKLAKWKKQIGFNNKDAVGRNLAEIMLYIYTLFVMLAVLARWIALN